MLHDEVHEVLGILGMLHDDHELDTVGISKSCVAVQLLELIQLLDQLLDQLLPHDQDGIHELSVSVMLGEAHDGQLIDPHALADPHDPHDDIDDHDDDISMSCVVVQLVEFDQLLLHEPQLVGIQLLQLLPSISVMFGEAHDGQLIDPHELHELQLDDHDDHPHDELPISISLTAVQFVQFEADEDQLIDPHELGAELVLQLELQLELQLLQLLAQLVQLLAHVLELLVHELAHDELGSISLPGI